MAEKLSIAAQFKAAKAKIEDEFWGKIGEAMKVLATDEAREISAESAWNNNIQQIVNITAQPQQNWNAFVPVPMPQPNGGQENGQ